MKAQDSHNECGTAWGQVKANLKALLPTFPSSTAQLYERWATEHLSVVDENVDAFCYFLSTETGALIRLQGLQWIASAVAGEKPDRFHRDSFGDSLARLVDLTIRENRGELEKNGVMLRSLVDLTAKLVSLRVGTALPLQERIKTLRLN